MGSMWDIGRKQIEDSFSSKKFLLILGLFLALSMGSVYMGVDEYNQQMENFEGGNSYGPVPEKPSLIDVFGPLVGLNLPLAAAILALLLSYDSISREREEGTIELLLSYPVYRDEIINGKFVAGLFTVATALLIAFTASSGLAIYLTGVLPSAEQVFRLIFLWQGSIVYMAFFFGLGTLLSVILNSSWKSLISGLVILLLFLATPLLANMAAGTIYPMDTGTSGGHVARSVAVSGSSGDVAVARPPGMEDEQDRRQQILDRREKFVDSVSKFSATTSFQNFASTMLGTDYDGETGLKPTVWENLRSAFGYLIFLLSETMLAFTGAYTLFMRQDL
ncbi:ABC transporter permease [Candidatus Nanosalina sp. VS9-1]|uniref:ABC transporter permease n=1 Tax=Candidatus Nanosalina sp. VS9-1 TaxID=3388566 RepID=UPI0039DF8ED8